MDKLTKGLCDFLDRSVSAFHAMRNLCADLDEAGFIRLAESNKWNLSAGGKYYVTRNTSSLIAFTIPECGFTSFLGVASHSDSPVFKIKPIPELTVQSRYTMLDTERYGGMIMNTWLDRPLGIAGRVIIDEEGKLCTKLIDFERNMAVIPSLAIHMNREVNDKCSLNAQVDMLPMLGDISYSGRFKQMIAQQAGMGEDKIVGCDLYLYNRMKASVWGENDEYISSARLDDLACAYASMQAFLDTKDVNHINFCCVFDNEEVGSGTRQGADSTFLSDVLERIAACFHANAEDIRSALASSFMVSADNAHAMHPNHPEKADAVNRPFMNEGIVIKHSANQKYTTDGISDAVFSSVCRKAGVSVQYFANRSDSVGGSTLGNISVAHVSIPSVDIGIAQLAMHSSYETAGTKDIACMVNALKAYYAMELLLCEDGVYSIN